MRGLALSVLISGGLLASAGLGFTLAAPLQTPIAPVTAKPSSSERSAVDAFPNCPAPAVNGMNIRTTKSPDGYGLTIFVVVQNVGHRAFFADAETAMLRVRIGDRDLGSFPVQQLSASEVKFYSIETTLPQGASVDDLVATLDFSPGAPVGRVENTLDCQTSDNRSIRRGPSLRASLERAAG